MARSFPPVKAGSSATDGSGMADRNPVVGTEYGETDVAPVPLTTRVALGPVLVSAGMVVAGIWLLWPVPVAGAVLMVAGGFGLAGTAEPRLVEVVAMSTPAGR